MAEEHRAGRWSFVRTTVFRLALLYVVLTLLSTVLLGGVAWWATVGYAARQAAQEVVRATGVLLQSAALSGLPGVALSIEARLAADRGGAEFYLLAGSGGRRLAGNLAQAPLETGWHETRVRRPEGEEVTVLMLGTPLPEGNTLIVGRDLSAVEALQGRLLGAAGWVGGGALLIGLLGGWAASRGVARRAAAMSAALAAVEAGELARRLPVRGGADEFDRLAQRINATLDRVQELMATLRQVTDDIAHDLRTPLGHLRQRLEAGAKAATPEAWQAVLRSAQAECDHLLELFEALLRIAEAESGTRRAGFRRFDLSAVAESVAEVYAPAAEERRQALETRIAPGIAAYGDPMLVTQLLANLVQNAVNHGSEGGRIALALQPAPEGAVIAVTDDGPGIPPEERERVFRRFHRLDAARSTPGSGLGLALVRAVAALHGMDIALEDAAPGLSVRVTVPRPPE